MKKIKCPISTIVIGICASMGAFLLSSGTKGLRYAYENCDIMIHQPLGGTNGQVSDLEITTRYFMKIKDKINRILSMNTGKSIKKIASDTDRDYFLSSKEAKDYGLIDEIFETISSNE